VQGSGYTALQWCTRLLSRNPYINRQWDLQSTSDSAHLFISFPSLVRLFVIPILPRSLSQEQLIMMIGLQFYSGAVRYAHVK